MHKRTRGFTLRELLAVVAIVALMLGLLLPALQRSNSIGNRRGTCMNNMRQVAISLLTYSETARAFPGYANVIHNKRASWVVPILRHLERNDLYQNWTNIDPVPLPVAANLKTKRWPLTGEVSPWAYSIQNVLICPSGDQTSFPDPLSYVVNCGSARSANDFFPPITRANTWVEDINSGIFFNHARADLDSKIAQPNPNPPPQAFNPRGGPTTSLDFVSSHDGTSMTLLVSENLQAATWATDPTSTAKTIANPFASEFQIKQSTGFVWFLTGNKDNVLPPVASVEYNPQGIGINQMKHVPIPVPNKPYPVPGSNPPTGGLAYARPSSGHTGGVNAGFCDGHVRFLADDIDYRVYMQLMTPNDRGILVAPDVTAAESGWQKQPMIDNDF